MLVPVIILGMILVIAAGFALWSSRYQKCQPNEVIVIYGRKYKTVVNGQPVEKGFKLLTGGGAFILPIVESYRRIPLSTFQVQFRVEETPNKDGVLVNVDALSNMKISSEPGLLFSAVERLLEMSESEVEMLCRNTLEAQLRQLTGNLTIEEIIQKREAISQQVMDTAAGDLNKLGFHLDNFLITKVTDKEGYIDALGAKRTAEVKRDAEISKAEAKREQDERTATARKIGELAQANADKEISDAQRDRDIAIADNKTKVGRRQARIEVEALAAGEDARAELEQKKVQADMARVIADTDLQKAEKIRREAELEATVVTAAQKEAEAKVISAQGVQDAAIREGEAQRIRDEKAAEGRKALAFATQAEKEANAAGEKAELLARAAGTEAQGKAEGAAILEKLVAEARGFDEKNKALADMSEGAKLIMVLEAAPRVIEELGEAGERIVGTAFKHIGEGLANIDDVRIVDFGGNGDAVANHAMNVPKIFAKSMAQLKASGIDIESLAGKAGIDISKIGAMIEASKSTKTEPGSLL